MMPFRVERIETEVQKINSLRIEHEIVKATCPHFKKIGGPKNGKT